jgi:cytochrome c oxidase assembly protein subunit 17
MENQIKSNNSTEKIEKPKLRPCCACPETKKLRDNCIFEKGEENCFKFIEDHKVCLREHGFLVD